MLNTGKNIDEWQALAKRNNVLMALYFTLNITLLLLSMGDAKITFAGFVEEWGQIAFQASGVFVLWNIPAIILGNILPQNLKDCLVFWRLKDPLPGCRVFSELIENDYRINRDALKEKIGSFPSKEDGRGQNALWYRCYRKFESVGFIKRSHSSYLLARDMSFFSLMAILGFCVSRFWVGVRGDGFSLFLSVFVLQWVIITSAAKNLGERFVLNVLAQASVAEGKL